MLPSVCIFEWKWRMKFSSCSVCFPPFDAPLEFVVKALDRRKGYSCSVLLRGGWLRMFPPNVGAEAMTSKPADGRLVLHQEDVLLVIVQQILHFYRACPDAHNSVAAIDEVTLHCDKDVFTFGKEDFPGLTRNRGSSKGLEVDGRILRQVRMSIFDSCLYW